MIEASHDHGESQLVLGEHHQPPPSIDSAGGTAMLDAGFGDRRMCCLRRRDEDGRMFEALEAEVKEAVNTQRLEDMCSITENLLSFTQDQRENLQAFHDDIETWLARIVQVGDG